MNYVVALPFDPGLAEFLGKKGSENGMTFYNRRSGSDVMVFLAPSSMEEKFYAVAEALTVAGQVIMSTASVDRLFGEVLVACSLLGKRVTFTKDNDIGALLAGMMLADHGFADRETLLEEIAKTKPGADGQAARVDIDKAFNVRGIGAVALGIVTKGSVRVHGELYHSSGKKVTIRSIQSQDEDIQEAGTGTRVGLALKGIGEDEVSKGDILTGEPSRKAGTVRANLEVSSVAREDVQAGKNYTLVSNFSVANAAVESIADGQIVLKLAKELALMPGDEFLLMREQVPRIFAKGIVAPQ